MTVFIRDFPKDLWNRFRALAALQDKSTRDLMAEIIERETQGLPHVKPEPETDPQPKPKRGK